MRLANVRSVVHRLAAEAGVRDAQTFAAQWQLLMLGAIIEAAEGEPDAAHQAREIGTLLFERRTGRHP